MGIATTTTSKPSQGDEDVLETTAGPGADEGESAGCRLTALSLRRC